MLSGHYTRRRGPGSSPRIIRRKSIRCRLRTWPSLSFRGAYQPRNPGISGAGAGFPLVWILLRMKYRQDENLIFFNSIQDSVWKSMIDGPPTNIEIQDLHRYRLVWYCGDRQLNSSLKALCEFWTDFAVIDRLGADISLRRPENSYGLQRTSSLSSANTCSAGMASISPRTNAS